MNYKKYAQEKVYRKYLYLINEHTIDCILVISILLCAIKMKFGKRWKFLKKVLRKLKMKSPFFCRSERQCPLEVDSGEPVRAGFM